MKTQQSIKSAGHAEIVARGSKNVFADLGFSAREAVELKVKADLTLRIFQRIKELGLTQVKAAQRLGLSQPDVSKLMGGRHTSFSVGRLLALLNALKVDIDIIVRPQSEGKRAGEGTVRVLEGVKA